MTIYVGNPKHLPALLEALTRRPDVIAARVGKHEIAVSLLGSRRAPWDRLELESRLREWQAESGGAAAELRP